MLRSFSFLPLLLLSAPRSITSRGPCETYHTTLVSCSKDEECGMRCNSADGNTIDNPMPCDADIFKGLESFEHDERRSCSPAGDGESSGDTIGVGILQATVKEQDKEQEDMALSQVQMTLVEAPSVKDDEPFIVNKLYLRHRKFKRHSTGDWSLFFMRV